MFCAHGNDVHIRNNIVFEDQGTISFDTKPSILKIGMWLDHGMLSSAEYSPKQVTKEG